MFLLLLIYAHWKHQEFPFDLMVIGIFSVLLSIYDLGIIFDSLLAPTPWVQKSYLKVLLFCSLFKIWYSCILCLGSHWIFSKLRLKIGHLFWNNVHGSSRFCFLFLVASLLLPLFITFTNIHWLKIYFNQYFYMLSIIIILVLLINHPVNTSMMRSTTGSSGASTSFSITSEGLPILDALTIVTRSLHNCRVFGYYGGIQKLTALMKGIVYVVIFSAFF